MITRINLINYALASEPINLYQPSYYIYDRYNTKLKKYNLHKLLNYKLKVCILVAKLLYNSKCLPVCQLRLSFKTDSLILGYILC